MLLTLITFIQQVLVFLFVCSVLKTRLHTYMTLPKTRKKEFTPPPLLAHFYLPLGGEREKWARGGGGKFFFRVFGSVIQVCNLVFNTEQTNKKAKTCCINVIRVSNTLVLVVLEQFKKILIFFAKSVWKSVGIFVD